MSNVLEGKIIANIALAEGSYNYYGFINDKGNWVIQREKTDNTEYLYAIGGSSYSTNWTNRASLTYNLAVIN